MPHRVIIDVVRRIVYTQITGAVTAAELLAGPAELKARPEFDRTFNIIIDLRTADLSGVTASDVQAIASGSAFAPSARRAIIADTAWKFGLARMYEIRRELAGGGERTRIFKEMRDALTWLGLEGVGPLDRQPHIPLERSGVGDVGESRSTSDRLAPAVPVTI